MNPKTTSIKPTVTDLAIQGPTLKMIEVIVNDRLGKKVRVKCCSSDTVGDLKKLISAHTGTLIYISYD